MLANRENARLVAACNSSLIEDACLALEKLGQQEVDLIHETEELFKRQVDSMKLIDDLTNYVPDMSRIELDTRKLASLVDSSSSLIEDVCRKVRKIDSARARLEECLTKVGDILDLKTCREGVQQAMKANNYEEASIHLKRFLSIDQEQLRKTMAIVSGRDQTSLSKRGGNFLVDVDNLQKLKTIKEDELIVDPAYVDIALAEIDEARGRLVILCQENMKRAIEEENPKEIERYFKLFPILNQHSQGLQRYAGYLKSKISNPLNDEGLGAKKANQADKLAALYESIAQIIDSSQPLIETYYGPGHLMAVIKDIQDECDKLSRKILEEFRNETKLQHVAKIVRSSSMQRSQQANSVNLTPPKLDPGEVDNILNEITLIISRSEVYLNFVVQRVKGDIESKCETDSQRQACLLKLYNLVCIECELNQLIQEVGGIYVMLEQYYLNESAKKAILMDQIDVETSSCFLSSMLDDIFFIIKKCTKRAISTKSNEVFCAIINHCVTLLESTFSQFLEERLGNQQYYSTAFTGKNLDLSQAYNAIQSGRYLQSTGEFELAKARYLSSLNNLDKACDYINTLRGILDADIKKLKPSLVVIEKQQTSRTTDKSATCLNELSQIIHKFKSIINSSLYQLFNSSLRNRLKAELKTLMAENPDLSRIVTKNPNELLPLARNLLVALDQTLKDGLTQENYSRLVTITSTNIKSLI